MAQGIPVTDTHPDHYLQVEASNGNTVVWRDGFTGLTFVVAELDMDARFAVGAARLVSVIDRTGPQTFAWAFHADSSASYIAEKIPAKVFNKPWRIRLSQSIRLALRLHGRVTAPSPAAAAPQAGETVSPLP